jgi:D-alanyl-lipoteichoic acid acyltransferase DltB (MBOAT superfamily)
LGTICFGLQIYCDFSGYSDIAIGAAIILGFRIPINFNKPYFASSPSDFWRRWHISLSSWLRDYLYFPLGGNKKSEVRTYFNLFVVMFVGGLWHGASWNFVLWGILHGVYLASHKFLINKFPVLKNISFFKTKLGKIISILITQYFVLLAWIPFRVKDTEHMFYSIQKFVLFDFQIDGTIQFIRANEFSVILILIFVILQIITLRSKNVAERISCLKFRYWAIFLTILMILVVLFYRGSAEEFIYFEF